MVKVNLIGKKRREAKGRNWVIFAGLAVYIGFVVYFFGSVVFVVYRLSVLNSQLATVENETRDVSGQMIANNDLLNKYVLSKFILGKIESINKTKFHYKDYLDQIANLMPSTVTLKNVDFSVTGWVSVLVTAQDIGSLKALERSITDSTALNKSVFSSVFSENVSKTKSGGFDMKLQFEIRKNG